MSTSLPVLLRSAVLMTVLGGLAAAAGCVSRCSSDADCTAACVCSDGDTCNIGLSCQNTFCEIEESPAYCEIPENLCDKYRNEPGGSLCGTKKCGRSEDCKKRCNCAGQVPGNPPTNCCATCTEQFTCLDKGLCDKDYAYHTNDDPTGCDRICGALRWDPSTCEPSTVAFLPEFGTPSCVKKQCTSGFVPGLQTN